LSCPLTISNDDLEIVDTVLLTTFEKL